MLGSKAIELDYVLSTIAIDRPFSRGESVTYILESMVRYCKSLRRTFLVLVKT